MRNHVSRNQPLRNGPKQGAKGYSKNEERAGQPGYVECVCGVWAKVKKDGSLWDHKQPGGLRFDNRVRCLRKVAKES